MSRQVGIGHIRPVDTLTELRRSDKSNAAPHVKFSLMAEAYKYLAITRCLGVNWDQNRFRLPGK